MTTASDATSASPPMTRKSWYMSQDTAGRLASAVDDIHHATRLPRHQVIAALVDVAITHRAEIAARLAGGRAA